MVSQAEQGEILRRADPGGLIKMKADQPFISEESLHPLIHLLGGGPGSQILLGEGPQAEHKGQQLIGGSGPGPGVFPLPASLELIGGLRREEPIHAALSQSLVQQLAAGLEPADPLLGPGLVILVHIDGHETIQHPRGHRGGRIGLVLDYAQLAPLDLVRQLEQPGHIHEIHQALPQGLQAHRKFGHLGRGFL